MAGDTTASPPRPIPGRPGYFAGADGAIYRGGAAGDLIRRATRTLHGSLFVDVTDADGRRSSLSVAPLVLRAFRGPSPEGGKRPWALHADGDKQNCCIANLKWGTRADRRDAGVVSPGAKPKISAAQATEMMERLKAGETQASLAEEFGVAVSTVSAVRRGETWKDLGIAIGPSRRQPGGSGPAKVTAEQVAEMRRRRAAGERAKDLAPEFGLSYNYTCALTNGSVRPGAAPRMQHQR
jgi:transposase